MASAGDPSSPSRSDSNESENLFSETDEVVEDLSTLLNPHSAHQSLALESDLSTPTTEIASDPLIEPLTVCAYSDAGSLPKVVPFSFDGTSTTALSQQAMSKRVALDVRADGKPGAVGKPGSDGKQGKNGANGNAGAVSGADGAAGQPGDDGTNGLDGCQGADGSPGKDVILSLSGSPRSLSITSNVWNGTELDLGPPDSIVLIRSRGGDGGCGGAFLSFMHSCLSISSIHCLVGRVRQAEDAERERKDCGGCGCGWVCVGVGV